MLFDVHEPRLRARVRRSDAGRELAKRGREALGAIAKHLSERKSHAVASVDEILRIAWAALLADMENEVDARLSGPTHLQNTAGWIVWARDLAAIPQERS